MPALNFLPLPRASHPKPPGQTDGLPTLPGPCGLGEFGVHPRAGAAGLPGQLQDVHCVRDSDSGRDFGGLQRPGGGVRPWLCSRSGGQDRVLLPRQGFDICLRRLCS